MLKACDLAATLNARDVALIIWIVIFLLWSLTKEGIRNALFHLVATLFRRKMLSILIVMFSYIVFIDVATLYWIGIWNISQAKTTLYWSVTVGLVTLVRSSGFNRDGGVFGEAVREIFGITVVIDFFVNLYVFSLPVELIIVPVTAFMGGMLAMAESDDRYASVRRLLNGMLLIFVLVLIAHAGYRIIGDFDNFAKVQTLRALVVPPALLLVFLPFIYLSMVVFLYETLFIRLSFVIKDQELLKFAKRRLLVNFNLRLGALQKWSNGFLRDRLETRQDVIESIRRSTTAMRDA